MGRKLDTLVSAIWLSDSLYNNYLWDRI